jgi:drug/metabolite transporter (DMT)-like permease
MAFVAQRVGMDFIGPFLFNGIRMCLGAFTLLIVLTISNAISRLRIVKKTSEKPLADNLSGKRLFVAGLVCGLVLFLAGNLQQVGLVFTTASKGGFLTALYIVLVPILGIALRHKTHWNTWLSVLIAACGLYFLCITEVFTIEFGDIIMLIGAVFWACHILVIDHFVEGLSQKGVMKLCIAQFTVAAALSLITSPILDHQFVIEAFKSENLLAALPAVLYTGILSTGVAFTLQAFGQQDMNPSAASIIMSLEAGFSVVGGMIILHEILSGREVLGCILMFVAVILSQLPVAQAKKTG